jgi:nicotinamidase/pyrazinamidase
MVYFDIDTQIDFVYPAGALYVPGAERLIPVWASLNRHAMDSGIPLLSSVCAHTEDDEEFREWPPHCVAGTKGQEKPPELMVGQIVVKKRQLDLFSSPEIEPLLERLKPGACAVYGVVTEYCVRLAAMGLLSRGLRVTLVTDAIQSLDPAASARFFAEFESRGGALSTTTGLSGDTGMRP